MNEVRQRHVSPKATRTNSLKIQDRHPNPTSYPSSEITEKPISHNARDPSVAAGGEHLLENGGGLRLHGSQHLRELEDASRVLRRQPVGDRLEPKPVSVLSPVSLYDVGGVEEAAVDVLSVEECDSDAFDAEDFGEFEHAVDGAL